VSGKCLERRPASWSASSLCASSRSCLLARERRCGEAEEEEAEEEEAEEEEEEEERSPAQALVRRWAHRRRGAEEEEGHG